MQQSWSRRGRAEKKRETSPKAHPSRQSHAFMSRASSHLPSLALLLRPSVSHLDYLIRSLRSAYSSLPDLVYPLRISFSCKSPGLNEDAKRGELFTVSSGEEKWKGKCRRSNNSDASRNIKVVEKGKEKQGRTKRKSESGEQEEGEGKGALRTRVGK